MWLNFLVNLERINEGNNMWIRLEGKLPKPLVESCRAVAVKYNNDSVSIKEVSKDLLYLHDMSRIIKYYRIIQ